LDALGFHLAGFGCTTCIGNSGPLAPVIEKAIKDNNLNVAAVLSGNRNFEARIHQRVKSNFLASPMLVVALGLAGQVDIDLTDEPVGLDPNGEPVYLDEIWPTEEEIQELAQKHVKKEFFSLEYGRIFDGDDNWQNLPDVKSVTYAWDEASTYIKRPPYFDSFARHAGQPEDILGARVLLVLGDSVTTDHISPAGAIPATYPAGKYLIDLGVDPEAFNSYGSRRGNHEVMMRGTFGNIRLKNQLMGDKEGSYTQMFPESKESFIYEAAIAYLKAQIPLIILAGKEYGAGSSRDWAAKGSRLLGVKAVLARSFERIHRSNLVGMGLLPLVFDPADSIATLGLDGTETFTISGIADITPRKRLQVEARKAGGRSVTFSVTSRLDSEVVVDYYKNGGILPFVLRKLQPV
jgi:aconitate hydratase